MPFTESKNKLSRSSLFLSLFFPSLLPLLFLLTGIIFLTGCGSNSEAPPSSVDTTNTAIPVNRIVLTATPEICKINSNSAVTATLYDQEGKIIPAGVEVVFTADNLGAITPSKAYTNNEGKVLVTFLAGNATGNSNIHVQAGPVIEQLFIQIQAQSISGSIEFVPSEDPDKRVIGVKGSGTPETIKVTFLVRDNLGYPVDDGREVFFTLLGVSGDEYITNDSDFTQDGLVSAFLNSGTVSGTVAVVARTEVNGEWLEAASREFIICSGPPDARHFSIAATKLNIAGLAWDGKTTNIQVRIADQYGNPVPEGTSVYFTTECGSIIASAWTDPKGYTEATLTSQNPKPTDDGMVTVMAYTVGQESYADLNSNGVFDGTDFKLFDISDPYLDADFDGLHDIGERFWDGNMQLSSKNKWDAGNGVWDNKIFIWGDLEILFSGHSQISIYGQDPHIEQWGKGSIPDDPKPLLSTFLPDEYTVDDITIPKFDYKKFYVVVTDELGNGLTEGTNVNMKLSSFIQDPNMQEAASLHGDISDTIALSGPSCSKKLFEIYIYNNNDKATPANYILYAMVSSTENFDQKLTFQLIIE